MGIIYEYRDDLFYLHHTESESPDPYNKSFSMQLHDMNELYYCISGSGEFIVEGNSYRIAPGTVMFLRGGEAHNLRVSPDRKYERIALLFSPSFIDKSPEISSLIEPFKQRQLGRNNCFTPDIADTGFIHSCLMNMKCGVTPEEKRMAIAANLPATLACLMNSIDVGSLTETVSSDEVVGEIVSYINSHLFMKWTLDDLQSSLHRNKDYLGRRFRAAMGSSIWEYTTHKRIIAARRSIIEGCRVSDVYERSGFGDYSSFYRHYKAVTGVSPSDDAKRSI